MASGALESESAASRKRSNPPPHLLAAILRMDLMGSKAVIVQDEGAFLRRMSLLRLEANNKEAYPSLLGEEGGEGDSIRLAFRDIRDALRCAILLRHRAQQPIFANDGMIFTLATRMVLHFGEFTEGWNGRIEGRGQILVTRLAPAVPPGEILATQAFADIAHHLGADRGYRFDYVGQYDLTKDSGKYPCYALSLDPPHK
jgi:hypothetical protein